MDGFISGLRETLSGKKILVGLTYTRYIDKAIEFTRQLVETRASVSIVLSSRLERHLSPEIIGYLTRTNNVYSANDTHYLEDVVGDIDLMVITPCSLDVLSSIVYGVSMGDPVVETAIAVLGMKHKLVVNPVVPTSIYNSIQYKRLVREFIEMGGYVVEPVVGDKIEYPPLRDMLYSIDTLANRDRDLSGYKVLLTIGTTVEYLDPVKYITNKYYGELGVALALELKYRGAEVYMIHGSLDTNPPYGVESIRVETTREMAKAVREISEKIRPDIAVLASSPSDYRPVSRSQDKISTRIGEISLRLRPTIKTIKSLRVKPCILVLFSYETTSDPEKLVEKSIAKLQGYNPDIIVCLNQLARDIACIVHGGERECIENYYGNTLARKIVDHIATLIGGE